MTSDTTNPDAAQPAAETAVDLFDDWFDSIEMGIRARVRECIEALIRGELDAALARPRYGGRTKGLCCPKPLVLPRRRRSTLATHLQRLTTTAPWNSAVGVAA